MLRHGIAEEWSPNIDNSTRSLTPEGEIQTRRVIHKLKELNCTVDQIFTTIYMRAVETAQIAFLEGLGKSVEVKEELKPSNNSCSLLKLIGK